LSQSSIDPTEAIAELGRIRLSDSDLQGVLSRVAKLAKRALPNTEEVSVTLIDGRGAYTVAFTGALALELDEQQYAKGEGPCLAAATTGQTHAITDIADETRWPAWTAAAARAGVKSSLSIGMPIKENVRGALNVYSRQVDAFDENVVQLTQTFVGYAVVAMANAHLYDSTATLARQLQAAMESRAVIEQAKGIIMAERRCSPNEAFEILAKLSHDSNRKLRDVAAALVAGTQKRRSG
jgi:GAF domain-containing protein